MNRIKRASKNITWSVFNTIIGLILPFATQTCIIYILGIQYVGLNSLFTSVLEVLNLTELGIGGTMVYSMYKPIANGDDDKVCALLALYRKCYRIIGIIVLSIGLIIMPFIKHFISGDVPAEINVYGLFAIYLFNAVISYFMFAYKTSILLGHQKVDIVSIINTVTILSKTVAQIVILIYMKQYLFFVVVIPICTILQNGITGVLVSVFYPQYSCKGKLSKEELTDLKKNIIGMMIQKFGEVVLFSVDNIVVSAVLGIYTLGIYSNYLFVYKAVRRFTEAIQNAIQPIVGNYIATESKEKNNKIFKMILFCYLWMASFLSICMLCLYQPFIKLWVGPQNMLDNITMICFVIYFYVLTLSLHSGMYCYASGILWEGRYIVSISAIVNLVMNIILVNWIGLKGVLLSTVFAVAFIHMPFRVRIVYKYYFGKLQNWIKYIANIVGHSFLTVLIAAFTYWICSCLPEENSILLLIERLGICIVIPNILLLICYCKNSILREGGQYVWTLIKEKRKKI